MTPPNVSLLLIMVCFWVTLWIVHRFLIRPVGLILDERKGRVAGAEKEWRSKNDDYLSATARLQSEIEDAAKLAGQVRAEHRQQALEARHDGIESARADAESRLQAALVVLESEAETARQDLRRQAASLAALFASQLLHREVRS